MTDRDESRRQGAIVLEAAAKIVVGSIKCGMLGDERTMHAAAITAEFLRQHAHFVRIACEGGKPFQMEVPK